LLVTTHAIAIRAGVFVILGSVQIVATTVILLCATKYASSYCASHVSRDVDLGGDTRPGIGIHAIPEAERRHDSRAVPGRVSRFGGNTLPKGVGGYGTSILTPFEKGGESSMCLTCGCLLPHEDHGNPEYLTIEGLERSAALDGYDLDTALQNLIKTVEVAKQEAGHEHR
jgi:hypothetical protein